MRTRRVISFLLGAWMAASGLLTFVENENLRSVERVLENAKNPFVKQLLTLGPNEAHADLRYAISEMNRSQTETFEWLQLVVVVLIAGLLLMSQHTGKWSVILGCVLVVCAMAERFAITPELNRLGRQIDIVPVTSYLDERNRYFAFQSANTITHVTMWLAGAALAFRMMITSALRHIIREVDALDEELPAALRPTRRGR